MYINTHSHIYDEAFDADREEVFQKTLDSGISMLLLPNNDLTTIAPMMDFFENHSDNCRVMMGLHPEVIREDYVKQLTIIEKELEKDCWVGIGEIGLDFYWDKTFIKEQEEAFRQQLRWAKQLGLPVSVHTREAFDTLFNILDEEQDGTLRGVLHCFNGSKKEAEHGIGLGFMLGLGGVITYKNCGVKDFLAEISMQHLVLETDDPYLSPIPYRGKRNEPSYMIEVAKKIAEIKNIDIEEVAETTSQNAKKLFKL